MKARIQKLTPKHERRKRPDMDPQHKKNVASLPCVVCGWSPSDPHHLMHPEPNARGLSYKAADRWCVPLCRQHHIIITDAPDDEAWLAERGVDGRAIANALWAVRGDPDAMFRIITRHSLTQKRKPMTRVAT